MMNRPGQKKALLVHTDIAILGNLQNALTREGYITIVARDLPSALLAVNQHQFQLAAVAADLAEPGAGWPLAGVLRLAFPRAFVCMLDQEEPQISGIRSAINYGVQQIYRQSRPGEEIAAALLDDARRHATNRTQ